MATYVDVPLAAFELWAEHHGFRRVDHDEVCLERADTQHPGIVYRVYTSVPSYGASGRGVGEDAVRVVALARAGGRERPLAKTSRVYRVTSVRGVFDRLLLRLREVSADVRSRVGRVCPRCGGPSYVDSGACVFRECREAKG